MDLALKMQQLKPVNSNQEMIMSGEDGYTKNSDIISVMNNFTYMNQRP